MTFDEAVQQLGEIVGRTVLVQIRPVGHDQNTAELLDSIDHVWGEDADVQFVIFSEAEASVILRREDFVDADWKSDDWTSGEEIDYVVTGEDDWRPGEGEERVLRIRIGSLDIGFQVTQKFRRGRDVPTPGEGSR
jgi:hypothetical protein